MNNSSRRHGRYAFSALKPHCVYMEAMRAMLQYLSGETHYNIRRADWTYPPRELKPRLVLQSCVRIARMALAAGAPRSVAPLPTPNAFLPIRSPATSSPKYLRSLYFEQPHTCGVGIEPLARSMLFVGGYTNRCDSRE